MWLGSRGRSGQIMVMGRIRYIRELQNIFIKVMMDLNNSIIRYGLKRRERIGRRKIRENRSVGRIRREIGQRNEIKRLRTRIRRERKLRFMENHIPRNENDMRIKVKKFITFDIKRVS